MSDRYDVIVAGAGPVGLITALKLARAGVKILVVDKLSSVMTAPRAVGYQWPSPLVLEDIGVLEEAIEAGVVKTELEFRRPATDTINRATLKCLEVKEGEQSPYDLALGQDVLANIVVRHLEKIDKVEFRWNSRVTGVNQDDDEVCVALETHHGPEEARGSWLVGADGFYSTVRDVLGLPFEGHTWPDRFVATNVYYDFAAHGYGPTVFVTDPVNWAFIIQINKDGLWRLTYGEDASLPGRASVNAWASTTEQFSPTPTSFTNSNRSTPTKCTNGARARFESGACCLLATLPMSAIPPAG